MNKERLLKLAEHLESGKLGHKVFDFTQLNSNDDDGRRPVRGCGTLGCAIGECPIAFPDEWIFDPNGNLPMLISGPQDFLAAEQFFDIDSFESGHLFCPNEQTTKTYGGRHLGDFATAAQVASNIRAFVKTKENSPE